MSQIDLIQKAISQHQSGRHSEALRLYQKILKQEPRHVQVLTLLSALHFERGYYEEAERVVRRALEVDAQSDQAHCSLGNIHQARSRFAEAAACYQRAIALNATYHNAYNNLGMAWRKLGKLREALEPLQTAIRIDPDRALYQHNLGLVYHDLGELALARGCFEQALQMGPPTAEFLCSLGAVLNDQVEYDQALLVLDKARELEPNNATVYLNMGNIFRNEGKFQEALMIYAQALKLAPKQDNIWISLGLTLQDLEKYEEAQDCFRKALEFVPESVGALDGLGVLLDEIGESEKGLECLAQALAREPENFNLHFHRGTILLKLGRVAEAWPELEWRLRDKNYQYVRSYKQPAWDGTALQDKKILIHGEQGIADELMYATCLGEVITQSGYCILQAHPKLVTLLKRSFPGVQVETRDQNQASFLRLAQDRSIDFQAAMGSLMTWLRPSAATFVRHSGYLVVDPALQQKWQERVKSLGAGLKVGISWRSLLLKRGVLTSDRIKGSTDLSQWRELFSLPNVSFIKLQYGDVAEEIVQARHDHGMQLHDWEDLDPTNDLEGLAALIANLDLVISIDSTAGALAGALGKPVWTLVAYGAGNAWPLVHPDETWFPSMTFYRQERPGDWAGVFQRIAAALSRLCS